MNRKALIIGAAYNDPEIPGVYSDLDVWDAFLKSPCGGAWDTDEVDLLPDPSRTQLADALRRLMPYEYTFLVFCGHGETVQRDKPWPETLLYFGEHGQVADSMINPGNPRCTILLDCCRGTESMTDVQRMIVEGKSASYEDRKALRRAFDDALNQAELGLVTIYAASEGEYAADDEKSFSKQLIRQSILTMKTSIGILYQNLAVELTAGIMKVDSPQQHPEYKGGRRLHHFPFAVNV